MIGTREREAPMTTDWNHNMDAAPRDEDVWFLAIARHAKIPAVMGWDEMEQRHYWFNGVFPPSARPDAWMPLPDPPKESETPNPEPSHD